MVNFGDLIVRLGLDATQFKAGLGEAKTSLVGWRDETNKNTGEIAQWGAAIGLTAAPLIAVGYELVSLTTKAAEFGKAIKDNARDLGLTTDQYQRWTHAAIASGSSAEEITGSIRMMSIRLKEAVDPTSEVARYLAAMGVSAVDANGKLRDTNAILLDVLPALNALPEGMDRNQASMVLFGRGFANIADLTSLTREELQKLMDQAPVFSDEKIQKMDEMAIEMALLNEQIQIMSVDLGEDLIPLAEDLIEVFKELGPLIKDIAGFLHEGATGTVMMGQGIQLLYTQWRYGMDSPEMKALQKEVQAYAQSEYDERSGEGDKHRYSSEEIVTKINNGQTISASERAWARKYDPQLYVQIPASTRTGLKVLPKPSTEKDPNAMTSYEIIRTQTDLSTLTEVTIPEQKLELKKLQEDYAAMGDRGSEAAKKIAREIIKLNNDITENGNKVAEMTEKLTKAGAAVIGSGGTTYNELLKSKGQSPVGPDWAGESDLAGMNAAQLQAVIDKAQHGGSKAQAEKAQMYLSMIGSGTKSVTGDVKTAKATDAVSIDTETVKSAETTTTKIKTQLDTRLNDYKVFGEGMLGQYIEMEKKSAIHWTAEYEMGRIMMQDTGKNWYDTAKQMTETIALAQTISVTDGAWAAQPIKFTGAEPIKLKEIDFSSVKFSAVGAMKETTTTKNDVKVDIVVNVDKEGNAIATADSYTTQAQQAGIGG